MSRFALVARNVGLVAILGGCTALLLPATAAAQQWNPISCQAVADRIERMRAARVPRTGDVKRLAELEELHARGCTGMEPPAEVARTPAQTRRMQRAAQAGEAPDARPAPEVPAQAPVAAAVVAAAPAQQSPSRVRTAGTFDTWNSAINTSSCQAPTGGHTRDSVTQCAQVKLDNAVAEGRLSRQEVDRCLVAPDRRAAHLGGAAFWAWSEDGVCKLQLVVKDTFEPEVRVAQAPAPTPAPSSRSSRCPPLMECGPPKDITGENSYRAWIYKVFLNCAGSRPSKDKMDSCQRQVVAIAFDKERISNAAMSACRVEWGKSPTPNDFQFIYNCLDERAFQEEASTSSVVEARPAPPAPQLVRGAFRRPEIIAALVAGNLGAAPIKNDADAAYYLSTFSGLNTACPSLDLFAVQIELIKRAQQSMNQSLRRATQGTATMDDFPNVMLAFAAVVGVEDCDDKQDYREREECKRKEERQANTPLSADAAADVKRFLEARSCSHPETLALSKGTTDFLLFAPGGGPGMDWVRGNPLERSLTTLFQNCRRQSRLGTADAWCACYAQKLGEPGSTVVAPDPKRLALRAATYQSAFVGTKATYYEFVGVGDCDKYKASITRFRQSESTKRNVSACLASEAPIPEAFTPELKACRYRTSFGQIEVRSPVCRSAILTSEWGGEPVACSSAR